MPSPVLPPPDPNRREFLRTSLAGSILLLGAAVLPSGCAGDEKAPAGLIVLTAGEYLTMEAVTARLIPRGGFFAPGAEDVGAARRIDRILVRLGGDTQRRITRALRIFEFAPLFSGHLRPFRRLSPADQDRVLHAWHASRRPFRALVFDAMKSLTMMAFYDSHAGHEVLEIAEDPCATPRAAPSGAGGRA